MNNIFKCLEKNKMTILIFFGIFILLYFQHRVIGMYFDDYGNASLSYAYLTQGVKGTNYNLNQLLEWATFIYNNWGGRILYAIVFIIPLLKHGITAYMIVQTFIMLGIFYLMYKIALNYLKDKKKSYVISIITFILYSCIDMVYLRDGIYWASASVLYIWPLLPLFLSIYLYDIVINKTKKKEKVNFWYYIVLFFSIIFTTLSQEQYGITLIAYIGSYIVFTHLKDIKKYWKVDLYVLLIAIISYLVLFMAPGNWVRMDMNSEFANLSLVGKIIKNMPGILFSIFFNKNVIFICLLCLIVEYMIYKLKDSMNKYLKYIFIIIPIILMILVVFNVIHALSFVLCLIWFVEVFIVSLLYLYKTKKLELMPIEIACIASEFCLLVSPTVGGRTTLPFIFIIFVIILCFVSIILNEKNNRLNLAIIILFLLIGAHGFKNYYMIYSGYRDNYDIYQLNDKIYKSYKEGDTITLYKVKNAYFGSTQSYQEPSMDIWIKEYYDIPQEVQFEWIDIYGGVNE